MTTLPRLLIAAIVAAPFAAIGCLEPGKCQDIKNRRYAEKREWEQCDPAENRADGTNPQCIIVGGTTKDCSGVFFCPFAVNTRFRDTAEQAVLQSLAESTVCTATCAELTCVSGRFTTCEPVSRRCILFSDLVVPSPGSPGAGTPGGGTPGGATPGGGDSGAGDGG